MHLDLLRQVPQQADTSALPQGEQRLIQSPLAEDEKDEHGEVVADWESYVTPSLRADLAADIECYMADLAQAQRLKADEIAKSLAVEKKRRSEADREDEIADELDELSDEEIAELPLIYERFGFYDLRIPAEHRAAWYSALNQARLVMYERHQFPDEDKFFTYTDDESEDAEAAGDEEKTNSSTREHLANLQAYQAYQFYAQIQSILLTAEDRADEEEESD